MKIITWSILLTLLNFQCTQTTQNKMQEDTNKAMKFLKTKNYTYSKDKSDIPKEVIESLSKIYNEEFKIGDSSDVGKISFSDTHLSSPEINNVYEYKRELHFILIGDSTYLLSYTQGGIGTHNVIEYFKYNGLCEYEKYTTTEILNDTSKLNLFFQGNPIPKVKSKL